MLFQMKNRGVASKRKQVDEDKKDQRLQDFRRYMSAARAVTEQVSLREMVEAEGRIGDFMKSKFESYIPLRHHTFDYEKDNVMRQYSKTTPEELLTKYNLYLGGEGQTEARFEKIPERDVSSVAQEREELLEDDLEL